VQRIYNVDARLADRVGAGSGSTRKLSGQDDIVATDAKYLSERRLGPATAIDVGRINEIHTGIERGSNNPVYLTALKASDCIRDGVRGSAEGHGAETYPRDERASGAQTCILHGSLLHRYGTNIRLEARTEDPHTSTNRIRKSER